MKNINGKKVTIYDIARISGFSPKTVSRVINGGVNVKEETYQAIKICSLVLLTKKKMD